MVFKNCYLYQNNQLVLLIIFSCALPLTVYGLPIFIIVSILTVYGLPYSFLFRLEQCTVYPVLRCSHTFGDRTKVNLR